MVMSGDDPRGDPRRCDDLWRLFRNGEPGNLWELTFDAVPDLIAIIDTNYRIIRVNRAMADRLGIAPEDAVGKACYEAVHHSRDPPDICPHQKLIRDGESHAAEICEESLHGEFHLTVSPIRDGPRIIGCVHVLREITEQKRVETALRESEEKFREI